MPLRRPLEIMTRLRLGWPRAGHIHVHHHGGYAFEQGADLTARLERHFGPLDALGCIDLGAGPSDSAIASQIRHIPWRRLIQVEAFPPYLEKLKATPAAAKAREIRALRIEQAVATLKPGEVDLALMIDVLEHFSRRHAFDLLARLERRVRRGIVLFIPLGQVEQDEVDANPLQRHLSFWNAGHLARLGYDLEVYERFHGQLTPPPDAAWAIKKKSR